MLIGGNKEPWTPARDIEAEALCGINQAKGSWAHPKID